MTERRKPDRASGRREFLRLGCATAAGTGLLGLGLLNGGCSKSPSANGAHTEKPPDDVAETVVKKGSSAADSTVVTRADNGVFGKGGHVEQRVYRLVNDAVCALVGVTDPSEAFRALFEPGDVVAIKPNCLAGPGMSTSLTVVTALVRSLRSIGIEHRNIYIWERTSAELERAGFKLNQYSDSGPRCYGNDTGGFGKDLSFSGEVGSLWSNVLSNKCTALINVPVLKDHDLSGVGCGMKNMYGAIHNPNRYHDNNCDPYVADVNAHPAIKDKLRLVLADALTAQYHGGPARVMAHQWKPGKVLASNDPVALDRIAQTLLEEQRSAHGMASLEESRRSPRWLSTAAARGLGEHLLENIELNEG